MTQIASVADLKTTLLPCNDFYTHVKANTVNVIVNEIYLCCHKIHLDRTASDLPYTMMYGLNIKNKIDEF